MARTIRLESSGGDAPRRALSEIAGFLSVPARLQAQQQQTEIDRAVLQRLGMAPEEISRLAPPPPIQLPQTGIAGRALSGIGQVGSLLSTALGTPVEAPRPPLGTLLGIEQLRPGQQQQQAFEAAADVLEEGEDPLASEDAARKLTVLMMRAGQPGIAAKFAQWFPEAQSLNDIVGRIASRTSQAPVGSPLWDSDALSIFLGVDYLKAKGRFKAETDPNVVEAKARIKAAESFASRGGALLAEAKQEFATMQGLIPDLKAAVTRRIKARSWSGRLLQGARLKSVLDNPWIAENLLGVQPDPTIGAPEGGLLGQRVMDVKTIEMVEMAGRKFLTGARLDNASKMSDKDVEKVAKTLPSIWDSEADALSSVLAWERFLERASQYSWPELMQNIQELLGPLYQLADGKEVQDDFEQIQKEVETEQAVELPNVDQLIEELEQRHAPRVQP